MIWLLLFAAQAEVSPSAAATPSPSVPRWRVVATEDDRRRLRGWRAAWMDGLAGARRAPDGVAEIAREGPLLDPDVALTEPAPPPGDYDCRTIKLGSQVNGLTYVTYPPVLCRIETDGDGLAFTKVDGSQRPIGRLYPDHDLRMVFLGTMQLGDERRAYQYGIDSDRNMIGMVQRIGPSRWRLVLPSPHYESRLDVIELVPRAR